MKPIAIISNNPRVQDLVLPEDVEVWGMNIRAMNKARVDVVIDIHPLEYIRQNSGEEYLDWLKNLTKPLYMQEKYFPNATVYPYEEVFNLTKHIQHNGKDLKFLTSTVAMVIAFAVLQNPPRIDLYGFEFLDRFEYIEQREAYCFWVGFAGGRGIPLEIQGSNSFFDAPIYGVGL